MIWLKGNVPGKLQTLLGPDAYRRMEQSLAASAAGALPAIQTGDIADMKSTVTDLPIAAERTTKSVTDLHTAAARTADSGSTSRMRDVEMDVLNAMHTVVVVMTMHGAGEVKGSDLDGVGLFADARNLL
jgi:hypothetical protein